MTCYWLLFLLKKKLVYLFTSCWGIKAWNKVIILSLFFVINNHCLYISQHVLSFSVTLVFLLAFLYCMHGVSYKAGNVVHHYCIFFVTFYYGMSLSAFTTLTFLWSVWSASLIKDLTIFYILLLLIILLMSVSSVLLLVFMPHIILVNLTLKFAKL